MLTLVTRSTVLAVELDKAVAKEVRKALPTANLVFTRDARAVAQALRTTPDVILVGAALPERDGFSLLKSLRLHKETRDVPIIRLTANAEESPEWSAGGQDLVVARPDLGLLPKYVAKLVVEHAIRKSLAAVLARLGTGTNDLTRDEQSALESGGFPLRQAPDPAPFAQHAAKYQSLLSSSLTTEQAARRLGVNASRVRQRLLAQPPQLHSVRQGNAWRLSAFQFGRKGLVPNIDKVIPKLDRDLDPVVVEEWFRRPNADLDQEGEPMSPLAWLAQGKRWAAVADLAENL